jgi:NTP pyrophosphatase (non-canonical NTP hydrolase)
MSTPRTDTDDLPVDAFIWHVVQVAFRSLDQVNGSNPPEITLRILKIGEEYGEAVQAWIGVTGANPRKGITHTRAQVADELGDIAITALVAASSLGFDPRQVLAGTAATAAARSGDPASVPGDAGLPRPDGAPDDGAPADQGAGVEAFIWARASAGFRAADATTGSEQDEITLRLLRIAEEYGRAAKAWLGVTGPERRNGVPHTRQQVADQLGDVAFGALVAAATMGFDPRQVLVGTAGKVAARFGIPAPPAAAGLAPPERLTPPAGGEPAGPGLSGGAMAGDLFTTLVQVAGAQTRRFPKHNGPFARVTRLTEETGEVAQQVNHAEDTGIKTEKYGPFDPAKLAAEIADVLLAATGIAVHYDIADQVRADIEARHARYRDQGFIPAPSTPSEGR